MLQEATQPTWDVVALIQTVGFPIVVALYLLVRLERRLRALECAIARLVGQLEQLSGQVTDDSAWPGRRGPPP